MVSTVGIDDVTGDSMETTFQSESPERRCAWIRRAQRYHHVARRVAETDPEGMFIAVRWVDVKKGTNDSPKVRSRLVAQEVAYRERRDDLHAPTQLLAVARFLLAACASRGRDGPCLYCVLRKHFIHGTIFRGRSVMLAHHARPCRARPTLATTDLLAKRFFLLWPRPLATTHFYLLWPRPILATTHVGQTDFGHKDRTNCGAKKKKKKRKNEGSDGAQRLGAGAHRVGPRRVGAQTQKKWRPKGWEGSNGEGPKFRAFFPLPLYFDSFSLSGVFSWNCGHGSRLWTTQNAQFGWSIE